LAELALHAAAAAPRDPDRRRLQTAWLEQRAAPPVELPEGGLGNTATEFLCRTGGRLPLSAVALSPETISVPGQLSPRPSQSTDGPARNPSTTR